MLRISLCLFPSWLLPWHLAAQTPDVLDNAIRVGPGIELPRALYRPEPEFSQDARDAHVQGNVVLQLAIDESGRPIGIAVLSPLGFGLDERAQDAVATWKFAPGTKDGKPVKILATVEVHFRLGDYRFDEKAERQRTAFNVALQTLKRTSPASQDAARAVKSMQDLSRQGFSPAMCAVGIWETAGDRVAKDPVGGLALLRKAASKNYGPALFEIAIRQIEGRDLPADSEKGFETMRQASVLGSTSAQFFLGTRYEAGNGVARDLDRARRHYRLCAAQGVGLCQYRLGKLLLENPGRPERDCVQAAAWLQLAGEQGTADAEEVASAEVAKMTLAQIAWMTTLKAQLVHK